MIFELSGIDLQHIRPVPLFDRASVFVGPFDMTPEKAVLLLWLTVSIVVPLPELKSVIVPVPLRVAMPIPKVFKSSVPLLIVKGPDRGAIYVRKVGHSAQRHGTNHIHLSRRF